MATILEFRVHAAKSQILAAERGQGLSAEVVIFPGVRYERHVEDQPATPRRSKSRQRDRLELDE
jgi:hypothetical protein